MVNGEWCRVNMTTIEIAINVVISIAAGAVSGYGIFKFFGKKWVENWFAKDLKRYEHKLDVMKVKDEIRFNVLHKERIVFIKNLYQQVNALNDMSLYLIMPSEIQENLKIDKNELVKRSYMLSHKLETYLLSNCIYIPQSLEDRIAGMIITYNSLTKSVINDCTEEHKQSLEKWTVEKVRPLLNDLKNEFRRLLGVEFYDSVEKE